MESSGPPGPALMTALTARNPSRQPASTIGEECFATRRPREETDALMIGLQMSFVRGTRRGPFQAPATFDVTLLAVLTRLSEMKVYASTLPASEAGTSSISPRPGRPLKPLLAVDLLSRRIKLGDYLLQLPASPAQSQLVDGSTCQLADQLRDAAPSRPPTIRALPPHCRPI